MAKTIIERVLAAVDGSARGPHVLERASELATRYGAELYLLRTIEVPPEFPAAAGGIPADALPAYLTRRACDELVALAKAAGSSPAKVLARQGQPWRAILEASEELDVDVIVMGSHGYYGLDHLLGTTAAKVANLAKRDVLIVHARGPGRPR